ncbi:MAG: hypothetical protein AB1486_02225 [Planctomycetota bacterium]
MSRWRALRRFSRGMLTHPRGFSLVRAFASPLGISLLASASGAAMTVPEQDLLLHVFAGAEGVELEEVEFGRAFPLTVVRRWEKALSPEDWSDRALAPLVVRLVETNLREDGRHVQETRRYQGYSFSLDAVTVPAPSFKAWPRRADGTRGPERVASGTELRLQVKRALDPLAPGPPELPGELLPERPVASSWLAEGALVTLAVLVLLLGYVQWRAIRRKEAPAAPPLPAHVLALRRLQRLRAQKPTSLAEIRAFYVEAALLMRQYLEERFARRAPQMTTEQLLMTFGGIPALRAAHHTLLAEYLARCDLVKFARHVPTAPDHERHLDAAESLVLATHTSEIAGPTTGG